MKKFIILFILSYCYLVAFTQNKDELIQQIDSARSFDEMPVITVTAFRDHNYRIKKEEFNEITDIKKGDVFTLYFPIFIEKDNTWENIWYSYNYICLEPSMTNSSKIVKSIIDLDINKDDRQLYHKWLLKYEKLGKLKLKELDEK